MKNKMFGTKVLAIWGFLITVSVPIGAQYTDNMGGSWNNPTSASIGNIINDELWNRMRAKARARATSASSNGEAASPQKTPAQIDAAVRFRSTGTQLKTQSIADELSAGGTPEAKKQMFTILSTLLTEYEKAARAQGKPNDLALALTAALVYNSSIYNGTPEPDDARIMEIRDALAELAVEDGTFAKMTDRQKQELYETAVISTMLAKAGYEEAKKTGDNASATIYRNLAGQTLQAVSGMPPDKVDLTSQAQSINASPTDRPGSTQTSGAAIEHYEILQAYRDNKVAAEIKYQGKRVTIIGPVDFVLIEQGKPVLRMGVPAWSGLQMFCIFPVSQKAAVAQIVPNQRVTMECTVLGEAGGVSKIGRVDLGSSVGRLTLDGCVMR
jgi:hypothetical protein